VMGLGIEPVASGRILRPGNVMQNVTSGTVMNNTLRRTRAMPASPRESRRG